jgi:hypothetical protein
MRKAAERNIDDTWKRLGSTLSRFQNDECGRRFANAGYASI